MPTEAMEKGSPGIQKDHGAEISDSM